MPRWEVALLAPDPIALAVVDSVVAFRNGHSRFLVVVPVRTVAHPNQVVNALAELRLLENIGFGSYFAVNSLRIRLVLNVPTCKADSERVLVRYGAPANAAGQNSAVSIFKGRQHSIMVPRKLDHAVQWQLINQFSYFVARSLAFRVFNRVGTANGKKGHNDRGRKEGKTLHVSCIRLG